MKSTLFWRTFYYCLGLVFLALGITLNTKTALGISPLISVPASLCEIFAWNLGNTIAVYYTIMVAAQWLILGKAFRPVDVLQAPMSILFTRLINLFNAGLDFSGASLFVRVLALFAAILFTGLGAALTVDTEMIPNAADGLVSALSRRTGKEMGLVKNLVDLGAVVLTALLGVLLIRRVICIGAGTLLTMLGVGRVVAWFNQRFKAAIRAQSGLTTN